MPLGQTPTTLMFDGKLAPDVLHVAEEEAVREAERRAGLEVLEHFLEQLSLGSVGDQQQDEVGLAHDLEHLAEGAVRLREADLTRLARR